MPTASPGERHYGAAPGLAQVAENLARDRWFWTEHGLCYQTALDVLKDIDGGALFEYARRYTPDQIDELEMYGEVFEEDLEKVWGLIEDVLSYAGAAVARGETRRDETGMEHFERAPQTFRRLVELPAANTADWLRGNSPRKWRAPSPARAGSRPTMRMARPRGAGRPAGRPARRSTRSTAASGDDAGGEPPPAGLRRLLALLRKAVAR